MGACACSDRAASQIEQLPSSIGTALRVRGLHLGPTLQGDLREALVFILSCGWNAHSRVRDLATGGVDALSVFA